MARSRRLLGRVVKELAAFADRFESRPSGVVVLIYHRVGAASGLEIDLSVDQFAAQMELLASSGAVRSLTQALPLLADESTREPSVVVTFDDGTADFVDTVVPVLERYRVPAILYLATAFVEEGSDLPGGGRPVSWAGLREACSTGLVDVGSHTHRHRLLDRLSRTEVVDELDRSRSLIEERLQRAAVDFAYPKAVAPTPEAEREVRSRFRSAALAGTRINPYGTTDPYRLARSPIQVSDGMRFFAHKVRGGMALEDRLRTVANRRRYATQTS